MLDALGVVIFRDERVCKSGCSVIQCSRYVLMRCEGCSEECMAENVFCGQCIGRWRDIRAMEWRRAAWDGEM
jgi:hypothetical protein